MKIASIGQQLGAELSVRQTSNVPRKTQKIKPIFVKTELIFLFLENATIVLKRNRTILTGKNVYVFDKQAYTGFWKIFKFRTILKKLTQKSLCPGKAKVSVLKQNDDITMTAEESTKRRHKSCSSTLQFCNGRRLRGKRGEKTNEPNDVFASFGENLVIENRHWWRSTKIGRKRYRYLIVRWQLW